MTYLHLAGTLVRDLLGGIPLPLVRGVFLAVPILLLIWVLLLPARLTSPEDRPARWNNNLKIWAAGALAVQILIYALF